jgi:hypothetical protein
MKYGHGFALLSVASACCYFALSPLSLSLCFIELLKVLFCKARLNNAGLQKISFCSSLRAAWESPRSLLQKAVLGLVYFPNFSPNSTMQKEDFPSHQNTGTYMEY